MPGCPDCGATKMNRHDGFYICERCGLSLKPWEFQRAQNRARDEVREVMGNNNNGEETKKEREQRKYRKWMEGQIDDD